jgi:hypothetical protein
MESFALKAFRDGFAMETVFPHIRLIFAAEVPEPNGDNCLLTRNSRFVDLAFCRLLA